MQLPKLKKIENIERPKYDDTKKKILLLSDDIRLWSGISTMSRELIVGTAHKYNWVQIGAAVHHPDHGKVFDVSTDVNIEAGIDNSYVRIYAHSGYGNPNVLREIMAIEKPDVICIFTDPRYWDWIFQIENEIRSQIPLVYYNIWDAPPSPFWNLAAYQSCDLIMNISRQTHALVSNVLQYGNINVINLTKN